MTLIFPHRLRVRAQYTNSLKQTFLSYKPFLQDVYERSADSVACDLGESPEDTRVWHSKGDRSARSGERKGALAIVCIADVI